MATQSKTAKDPIAVALSNVEKSLAKLGKNKTAVKDSPFARFSEIETEDLPVISFGDEKVDAASNIGGVPQGRMVEIFGPESSGKSLLTLKLIGATQKAGHACALLDIEQSFDPVWAASHGVDVDTLVYANDLGSAEHVLEYVHQLARTGVFRLIVVDSTAALVPKAELEGSLEDNAQVGGLARAMSRGCSKIVDGCGKGNTTVVFINQIRMKVGVMYGNPETTPGGQALKFYSHQRIHVRKKGLIKVKENGQDVVVGQTSVVKFVKNKTARPFGECEFTIIFDKASLNPVVMLCNELKSYKLINLYKGLLNIKKGVVDNKESIKTGTATMPELADYIIDNDLVLPLLDVLIEEVESNPTTEEPLDAVILELKEDPSKIVSPKADVDDPTSVETTLIGTGSGEKVEGDKF